MKVRKRGGHREHVNFTLPSEMKRELEARANAQVMSVSHILRQLVRKYLKSADPQSQASGFFPISKPRVAEGGGR